MNCEYCGAVIANDAAECPSCGARLTIKNESKKKETILLIIGSILSLLCIVAVILFFALGTDKCADKWNHMKVDQIEAWVYFFTWFLPFSLFLLGRSLFLYLKPQNDTVSSKSFLRTFGVVHIGILMVFLIGALVMECIPSQLVRSNWDHKLNSEQIDYSAVFSD